MGVDNPQDLEEYTLSGFLCPWGEKEEEGISETLTYAKPQNTGDKGGKRPGP
jgi:hypothetical protein